MEWSKERTLRLIELLQQNATLWNHSVSDTRRDKQKRREELRAISEILGISIPDVTKKIQHLRTQYNRELAREAKFNDKETDYRYVSNWYAFDFLHFMKDSNKPYRVFPTEENIEVNCSVNSNESTTSTESKVSNVTLQHKVPQTELFHTFKPEVPVYPPVPSTRDEFAVFGEYIANELRSLKGEKNLLVAKKKIQDAIFEVKMGMIGDTREHSTCTVLNHSTPHNTTTMHSGKLFTTPVMSTIANIDHLSSTHTPPTSAISEIIINGHYSNFKVDTQ